MPTRLHRLGEPPSWCGNASSRRFGARFETFRQPRENTMIRRNILGIWAMMALSPFLLGGNAVAQQKSLKDQLVGTWLAVSWEQDVPNGPGFQPYAANPKRGDVFAEFV